jgi:hypothetical protein
MSSSQAMGIRRQAAIRIQKTAANSGIRLAIKPPTAFYAFVAPPLSTIRWCRANTRTVTSVAIVAAWPDLHRWM